MRKTYVLALFLILGIFPLAGQNSGIIYGDNWSYLIMAPDGFQWDSTTLQSQGIWGLFYKTDQAKYNGNKLNMYINPVVKGNGYPSTIDELIQWDTDFYKKNNPSLVITYYKDFELGDSKKARGYYFDDKQKGYYLLFSYITEEKASFVFVMSARSIEERIENENAYAELLKSFIYINKT